MRRTIYMPRYPECWSSCGACANGRVFILEILVKPGDRVAVNENVLVVETGKVALDIPSPYEGTVVEIFVTPGDDLSERMPLLTMQTEE
ncbi:MAG: biotin/lipoyl-containing protein [Methylophilaceae bacterium]|jgi:pyruvate/2-oxoglutarate dehydrogenase complex dihydrolipoamide acyltransferase (E2) component|nr:biotin/lipoyl-containing protein [Methylophilaceae bacterium]